MTLEDYAKEVGRTASSHACYKDALAVFGLGLSGESGEVADIIKKHIGHGHPMAVQPFIKELGDVLWYWMALCMVLRITPDEIMRANVEKLRKRYPDGFSSERSKNRGDE